MADRFDAAFVIADLEAGGAQRAMLRAVDGLRARGWRIAVVTLADPSSDFYRLPNGVRRESIGGVAASGNFIVGLLRNVARAWALRQALRRIGAPVALSFVTQTNILLLTAGVGLDMRLVVSERNDPRKQALGGVWRRLRDLLYPRASAVTANSQGAVETLAADIRGIAPVLLPNPPPATVETPCAAARPDVILNVGRLHRQKGQDTLVEAFAAIAPRHLDVRLVVAGEGGERKMLEAQARQLGIADRVDFPGAVSDIEAYYRRGPIFAFPSRHEGTPNALLEAMAFGLACVASNCSPGMAATIADGQDGMLVPPDDPAALAAALNRLLDDEALRTRIAAAALDTARQRTRTSDIEAWERVLGLV